VRWLASAIIAAVLPIATPAVPSPPCTAAAAPVPVGLHLDRSTPMTPRATDLTFTSAAMHGPVHAVVLLPPDYGADAARRYPVLYLLHGHGGGGYLDWPRHGVESVVGDLPAIVVMPQGGYDGWYSDWYGTDVDGHTPSPAPAWESFHLRELVPWIDATYRTIPARRARAVAGNSMGGFGAMSYAARHPDLFAVAGAFSGAVDPLLVYPAGSLAYWLVPNLADAQPPDLCIWGDPVAQHTRWIDHDPARLAPNLRLTTLYMRTGDGTPGRYEDVAAKQPSPGAVLNEFGIGLMNHDLDRALTREGVAHAVTYEAGIHDWPYWLDDLREFLPIMRTAFDAPRPEPPRAPFAYRSGAARFSVWGWTFATAHADESDLLTVTQVSRSGLRAFGHGQVTVDSAPWFVAGRRYSVNGASVMASNDGRLHFTLTARPSGATVAITPK
jgi:S-formylglutathione hydrolase FrmB